MERGTLAEVDTLLLLMAEPRVLTEARIWVEPRALAEVRALMEGRVATILSNSSKQQVEVDSILVIVIHDSLSPGGLNVIEASMQVTQVPRSISQSLLQRHPQLTNFLL